MNHPFNYIPDTNLKWIFWAVFLCTLVAMVCLNFVGQPLINSTAPYGIVSYEFAGSVERAQAILDSWDSKALLAASFSLGFDYLFMLFYSTVIALGCVWGSNILAQRGWPGWGLGMLLAWGQLLAASLDALENLALSLMLFNSPQAPWPQIAWIAASIKFGLIFFGLIFIFFALIVRLWREPGSK